MRRYSRFRDAVFKLFGKNALTGEPRKRETRAEKQKAAGHELGRAPGKRAGQGRVRWFAVPERERKVLERRLHVHEPKVEGTRISSFGR